MTLLHPFSGSGEQAQLDAQVKQVEQWWKVRPSPGLPCRAQLPSRDVLVELTRRCCRRSAPVARPRPRQSPRFQKTARPYSAKDVCVLRGTVELSYPSDAMGKKLVRPSCAFVLEPCSAAWAD